MKECGVSVDREAISVFFKQIEGKTIPELIAAGSKKLASMPACGGGGAAPAGGAAAKGGASAAPAKEEKKEEVENVDMGGLFGGDDEY